MAEPTARASLLRLMAWLSPAFPVGSYSYSSGLERAVHDGLVSDRASLDDWLIQLMRVGSAWNDAVLFAEAWRQGARGGDVGEVVALAEALAGSAERHRETMLQGEAFLRAASAWPLDWTENLPERLAYPVAIGAIFGAHGVVLNDALAAWLHAYVSNQAQAGIRLGVLGQSEATRLIAALEAIVIATAERAAASSLDELGASAFLAEIMAMKHETQYSRLFRS